MRWAAGILAAAGGWLIEPTVRQRFACGNEHARRQALAAGCDLARVHRVEGMVLRPAFHAAAPRVVVEFTPEVARWMRLADFFIGKPGPGSLSEAVHLGLPVIVTRNAWTMPQERWNTVWVETQGVGLVQRSFRDIDAAVAGLLPRLGEFQARVRPVRNDAVFAVPELIARLLAGVPAPARVQPAMASSP